MGRQSTTLQLIALAELHLARRCWPASGSVLTNKYAEGYPGRRYYGGNRVIDEVEDLARESGQGAVGAEHANVQPHAGGERQPRRLPGPPRARGTPCSPCASTTAAT